jgi:DNA-binding response OmpR family regulator
MALARIVIVEDEAPIRQGIAAALRNAGYEPVEAPDGEAGLAAARQAGVDLVLLDLLLPRLDGMDVLKQLRRTHGTLPVIILTARGTEDERVAGLSSGADDYVVKPFSARELLARIEAVLRRSPERPTTVRGLTFGKVEVDLERREVRVSGGAATALSETECAILDYLAANRNRAISRNELLSRVWGLNAAGVETRTIDMHVARLRSKLADEPGTGEEFIATVRGKGYMLGPNVQASDSPRSPQRAEGKP